jgi:Calx-beta domain/Dockerin type I domain/SdrD B-like domain
MKFSLFSGRNRSRRGSARLKSSFGASPWRARRLGFESLEDRRLLAIDATVQVGGDLFSRFDVNRDHHVTPVDALLIINDLNANGSHAVGNSVIAGLRTAPDGTGESSNDPLDINGDGMVSPVDALLVINQLNDGVEPQMQIRLEVTDLGGIPIAQVNQGDSFQLRAYVTDLRTSPPQPGVFAAYTDVIFDSALASVTGAIVHASDYPNGPSGSVAAPGLDEVGGSDGLTPLGPNERLLFTVPMQATGIGTVDFAADPADILPVHDSLLFGGTAGVPTNEILYGTTSLEVLPPAGAFLSITDVSLPEGDSGTTAFDFTVSLSEVSDQQVVVQYSTAEGTAAAGTDYQSKSDTLIFDPGQLSKTVTINVNGDTMFENDETFFVNLFNASGAPVGKSQGVGTIENDDAVPTVSIDSPAGVTENAGVTPIVFTVSLSAITGADVTVHFSTANGTATAGQDYVASPDTILTIPAGQQSATISVALKDDSVDEADETFVVNLSSPTGTVIGNGTGTGTILDDDPAPTVAIFDSSRIEPISGTSAMQFSISLSAASSQTIVVPYSTAPDTASADVDYVSVSDSVTFDPGETTKTISVQVKSDAVVEPVETFFVNLGAPTNATIGDGQAVGTIFDSLTGSQVQIRLEATDLSGNPISSVNGGDPFLLNGFVEDLRAVPHGVFAAYLDVLFDPTLVAVNSAITYGSDYPNIHAGITSTPGLIDEVGATSTETELGGGERMLFSVQMLGIGGGTAVFTADPADATGIHDVLLYGEITPTPIDAVLYGTTSIDITPPRLATIDSPMLVEGDSGSQDLVFTVTLSESSAQPVTINFATENGTATAGADYQTTAGVLTFDPGQTSKTIVVPVLGDTLSEADETFFVRMSGATGAVIPFGGERGTGTIKDNDPQPTLTIDDATAFEGATNAVFMVHLSAPSGQQVRVDFNTAPQTATSGADYQPAAGTLIIPVGQTEGTITVNVLADQLTENPETFALNLSGAVGAVLGDNQAIGTIRDLAFSSLSGFVYGDANDDGVRNPATERGFGGVLLTLTGTTLLGATVHIELRTNTDGSYHFVNLTPGVYQIAQTQPATLIDGKDTLGSQGGVAGNDVFTDIMLAPGVDGVDYNFGETGVIPGFLDLDNYFASSGGTD